MSFDRGQRRTNKCWTHSYKAKKETNQWAMRGQRRTHPHWARSKKSSLRCDSATRGERCATTDLHLLKRVQWAEDFPLIRTRLSSRLLSDDAVGKKPTRRAFRSNIDAPQPPLFVRKVVTHLQHASRKQAVRP